MATVAAQDLMDKIVLQALPGSKLRPSDRCLARLTAQVGLGGDVPGSVMGTLRELSSPGFRDELEYLSGFLRKFDVDELFEDLDGIDRVALQTHQTRWWVEYCFRVFGRAEAIRLLESPPRPRYVRLNSLRNRGSTTLPEGLRGPEGPLESVGSFPGVYRLTGPLSNLSSFFVGGLFQFQDLASYLAALAGEPKPGERVLDLCAAPGAKTSALAQLMGNKGEVVSVDYSRPRMKTWRMELERLGVEIGYPLVEDASRLGLGGKYDLVLLDPPCSGTGIFDRNPRMKWHLTPERVERYSQLQTRMLDEAYELLGPKGRIVYCTCSLTIEENEGVVSDFLRAHPEMELRPVALSRVRGSPGLNGLTDCRRFYPHLDGTAGYFIARLERTV